MGLANGKVSVKKIRYAPLIQTAKSSLYGVQHIGHSPGLYVAVVGRYGYIGKNSKYTKVFPEPGFPHSIQYKRSAMVTMLTTKASHAPFYPKNGNPHQDKTHQIRNNKGTSAILYCLNRESQKITQAHGISRHGKYQTDTCSPGFVS